MRKRCCFSSSASFSDGGQISNSCGQGRSLFLLLAGWWIIYSGLPQLPLLAMKIHSFRFQCNNICITITINILANSPTLLLQAVLWCNMPRCNKEDVSLMRRDFNNPTPVIELQSIARVSAAICTQAQKISQELVNGPWLPCEWPAPSPWPLHRSLFYFESRTCHLFEPCCTDLGNDKQGRSHVHLTNQKQRHTWKLFCLLISKYTNYTRDLRVYFPSWGRHLSWLQLPANLWWGRHIIFEAHQIANKSSGAPNMGSGVEPCCVSHSLHINPVVLWREGCGSRATRQRHHLLSRIGWLPWKQGIPHPPQPPPDEVQLPSALSIFFSRK